MDPTTLFAVDTFVVAAALLATQGFKSLLELLIKPTDARHDIIIRMFAVLVGIVGILIDRGQPSTADGHAWIVLVVAGALSGLSATGVYHFMSGSPGTVQVAPLAAPSPTDIATAVITALQPALARLVPPAYTFPAIEKLPPEPVPVAPAPPYTPPPSPVGLVVTAGEMPPKPA